MKEEITKKLDELALAIFHCTDDVLKMDLSGDKKMKISAMKFEVLSDFNKMVAEIKKELK